MFSSGCDMMEGCSNSNMDGEDINIEGEEFVDEGGDSEGREEPIGEKKKKASGGYTCCVPLGEGPRGRQLHMEVWYRCAAPVYVFLRLLPPGVWVRILNIFSFPRSMGMIYPNLSYFPYFYSRYPYLLWYKIFGN